MSRSASAVVLLAATGYALALAATHPFTVAADVLTALPIAAMALVVVVQWSRPLPVRGAGGRGHRSARKVRRYVPWLAVAALIVGWELLNFASHGPRSAHPTLSSMSDAVDRVYAIKAVVVVCWILLGALIVGLDFRRREFPAGAP